MKTDVHPAWWSQTIRNFPDNWRVNDNGSRLFETDPSGALIEYKATAIGAGRALAMEVFEKSYSEDMKFPEAMDLALDAIYEATEGKTTKESVEIAVIEEKNHRYRKLTEDEIEDHVEELLIRKSKEGEEEEE
jgi:proteasome alpha subunit